MLEALLLRTYLPLQCSPTKQGTALPQWSHLSIAMRQYAASSAVLQEALQPVSLCMSCRLSSWRTDKIQNSLGRNQQSAGMVSPIALLSDLHECSCCAQIPNRSLTECLRRRCACWPSTCCRRPACCRSASTWAPSCGLACSCCPSGSGPSSTLGSGCVVGVSLACFDWQKTSVCRCKNRLERLGHYERSIAQAEGMAWRLRGVIACGR